MPGVLKGAPAARRLLRKRRPWTVILPGKFWHLAGGREGAVQLLMRALAVAGAMAQAQAGQREHLVADSTAPVLRLPPSPPFDAHPGVQRMVPGLPWCAARRSPGGGGDQAPRIRAGGWGGA